MESRRDRFRFRPQTAGLERRELLAHRGAVPLPLPPLVVGRFHNDGVNGTQLDKSFVDRYRVRNRSSRQMAQRLSEAFQAFAQNYLGVPANLQTGLSSDLGGSAVNLQNPGGNNTSSPSTGSAIAVGNEIIPGSTLVPVGTIPNPSTLENFVAQLTQQVDVALSTLPLSAFAGQVNPSVRDGLRVSPLANRALVPFANQQIAQMGQDLADIPVLLPDGSRNPAALDVVNATYNSILNAVAQNTVHPHVFTNPSTFYLNPNVSYKITSSQAPIQAGPGFFTRGPNGQFLPGAPLHPYAPN